MTEQEVRHIVATFTRDYIDRKLRWQIGQILPGADGQIPILSPNDDELLASVAKPHDWLKMALYGARLIEADSGDMRKLCQNLAEWLFTLPGLPQQTPPEAWAETPMGALWWRAMIRSEPEELLTIKEAAALVETAISSISTQITRGSLESFIDPDADMRQGRRRVRKSDVLLKYQKN